MASQTLRPHRSPSPGPSPNTPVNPTNPAKLTRQSLGPPPSSTGSANKGFSGLGISSPSFGSQPRHVSSSVALGGRDSASPRPSMGHPAGRAVSGGFGGPRPSSEFLPSGMRDQARTPEAEQIDQWFKHLASWEATLEEMAAASTDQNFTEELGAIEQWFRVLSEAERTAALYSLLQHSTPVQIRFFLSVLHHMAQSDPMTALLSPNPNATASMADKLNAFNLKSPSAGGGSGFSGSPIVNQYLNPESALDQNSSQAQKDRLRQNRISAPGTLQPTDRWQGQLDRVVERGTSPGAESNASSRSRSRSPQPDLRPKSTDFSGKDGRSPRLSGGVGLGLHQPVPEAASPIASPFLNNPSWASMVNTPLAPMFTDSKSENIASNLNFANSQLGRVALDDPRKYRRSATGRNVSGNYVDDDGLQPGRNASPLAPQGGFPNQTWARSPVIDQFGLGGLGIGGVGADPAALAGLGVNFSNLGLGGLANANAAQMLALAQAQQQLNNSGLHQQPGAFGQGGFNRNTSGRGPAGAGRRSPMLGARHSPTPDRQQGGGGAGGGAGVAGPDDVDVRTLEDVSNWLRVLRLHKYTPNFERSYWRDMVIMTDSDLQTKGVAAQGARTKFLKVFYNVREKEGIPHPPGQDEYAPGAAASKEDK